MASARRHAAAMASARRHAAATPSTRPHESLRTVSRPRSAQGELLLRYPRILETRVIINRPSDVAVADPECKANSAANCVQARGNPLMGVFRRGNQSSSALQFVVSRGLREVLLAPLGRVYQRNVVSWFGPKTRPRCRDSNLTHWLISAQASFGTMSI
jgi:hypothetical protein